MLKIAGLSLLSFWFIFQGIGALAGPATSISIESASIPSGQTITIPINIQTSEALGSALLQLEYDSTIVEVMNVSNGAFWGDIEAGIKPGKTRIIAVYPLNPGKTGLIKFADVTLRATGKPGSASHLKINVLDIYNYEGKAIYADKIINGALEVK